MVSLEAQVGGRPVIAFGVGGSLETVRGISPGAQVSTILSKLSNLSCRPSLLLRRSGRYSTLGGRILHTRLSRTYAAIRALSNRN
jgi:hypothetical protein